MRILILGTGPFAVPTFHSLLDAGHDIPALFTRPDRNVRTRGKAPANPMREAAESRNIPVFAPESINEAATIAQLAEYKADLLMVCDYGQILSNEALATARLGGINLHGSLLPKYRGAAPVQWAVYHGDLTTGNTVILMTPRLDGGPILVQQETPIGGDETAGELEERLSALGPAAVAEAMEMLNAWDGESEIGKRQDKALVTKAPRLTKQMGRIDWTRTAAELHNEIRAFQPWPKSHTEIPLDNGKTLRVIINKAQPVTSDEAVEAKPAGTVAATGTDFLHVATGEGLLSLLEVQPSGKRAMKIGEFLNGRPLHLGAKLMTDA